MAPSGKERPEGGEQQRLLREGQGGASGSAGGGPTNGTVAAAVSFAQLRALKSRTKRSVRLAAVYVLIILVASSLSELFAALPGPDDGLPEASKLDWGIPYLFRDKSNVLNRFFVKYGWAWTTLAFAATAAVGSKMPPLAVLLCGEVATSPNTLAAKALPRHLKRDAVVGDEVPRFVRYAVATGYWYAMTQWCWGPPLLDRLFTATGGSCSVPGVAQNEFSNQCKRAGGRWEGGHDSSGHCMMLLHASLFLWEEIIAGGLFDVLFSTPSASAAGIVKKDTVDSSKPGKARIDGLGVGGKLLIYGGFPGRLAVAFTLALFILWFVMLVATSLHFHPLSEKLSGTIFGVLGWLISYVVIYPTSDFSFLPLRE